MNYVETFHIVQGESERLPEVVGLYTLPSSLCIISCINGEERMIDVLLVHALARTHPITIRPTLQQDGVNFTEECLETPAQLQACISLTSSNSLRSTAFDQASNEM